MSNIWFNDRSIVLMGSLLFAQGCMSPVYSALDGYSNASGMQQFTYYICQASSARAEGRVALAYSMDVEGWQVLKQHELKQPMAIQLFQQARDQGEKYTYSMAEKSCRSWSLHRPFTSWYDKN